MDTVLDAGAEDIRNDGVSWEILSPPEAHEPVLNAIQKAGIATSEAEIGMIPILLVKLEGKDASSMLKLSEGLEEHDDVLAVYANFDIDDKVMEALAE
jgi:transcriptional/translational regulatory protein YebC/TACO1